MKTFFAEVILPIAVPNMFTYRLPVNVAPYASLGMRIVVPFGRQKLLTGIICSIHENPPKGYTAKYMHTLLDEHPVVNEQQLKMWLWMSTYYMCHLGEIFSAALPIGLRLSSESQYMLNPAFDGDISGFSDKETLILQALSVKEVLSNGEISDLLEIKSIQYTLKKLLEASAILVMENLRERYTPKLEAFLKLSDVCSDEDGLQAAFATLSNAPNQEAALLVFLQLTGVEHVGSSRIKRAVLQREANVTSGIIKELIRKGIFVCEEFEVGRLPIYEDATAEEIALSDIQAAAFQKIIHSFGKRDVTLLHGITSSGKTEIYIELIKTELKKGRQVLYILPEIALTTQMIQRLKLHFGPQVAVYHSRFNQNERVEIWNLILKNADGQGRLILGARSAVFLPFSNLGLVIVDEEHETSFKQHDPAPRYHARDTAVVLAGIHGAKTLLGSATPCYETMLNATSGKYGYVTLSERYGGMKLPQIHVASLHKKNAPSGYFSKDLLDAMKRTLENREQIILFQNRRGYAPVLVCEVCAWAPECTRCDVTVTFHKSLQRLMCHYCGNRYTTPPTCPLCGSHKLKLAGFGTERIEEELPVHFPKAKIARLDLDSTRSKLAYQQILSDFQDGAIDILIGTQMVTKGLDFGKVNLVGILNADLLLKFPDFRSTERGFQLMTQVAGRAGRRKKRGQVIIQTHDVDNWVIAQVLKGDFDEVYKKEMAERRKFGYPPFTRLIMLTFRHRELELVDFCSAEYCKRLLAYIPEQQILGPEYPSVKRVRNRYNKNLVVKIDHTMGISETKTRILQLNDLFFADKQFRAVRLLINVDPQ